MGEVRILGEKEAAVESAVEMQRRSENCMKDIINVLKRWNCQINPMLTISGRGVNANFEVVPMSSVPADLLKGTS